MLFMNMSIHKICAIEFAMLGVLLSTGVAAQTLEASPSASGAPYYQRLLPEVLEKHPVLRAASRKIQAADADVDGARWQFFPTPSIGVESSSQANSALDSNIRFARLQQPLWTGGRLTAQVNKAQAEQEVAYWARQEQRQGLAVHWLELWADACAAQRRVGAYEASAEQHQVYLRQVQGRAKEGHIAQSEVQLAQSRLAATDADLETARAQQLLAQNKLRQLLGGPLPPNALAQGCALSGATDQSSPVAQMQELAEKNDASLRKYAAGVRSIHAELEVIRAQGFPEVYLRGEYFQGDVTGESRKASIGLSSNFGAGLSLGSAQRAMQSRADAQGEESEARRRDLNDQIASDDIQAKSQRARAQQLSDSLDAAGAYLLSAEKQFDAGRRSWQDLMSSAREVTQLRIQLIDCHIQAWIAAERLRLVSVGLDAYLGVSDLSSLPDKAGN